MADNISVSCDGCTGTCLNICSANCSDNCSGLCVSSSVSGVFGKDDDTRGDLTPDAVLGDKAFNCKTCTATCMDLCGNDCEGGCSEACTNGCTGTCDESCTFGCTGSCHSECTNSCGDECNSSCKLDCTSSCMGICEGCTGCSNTCKSDCEQQCIFSCVGKSTSAENGGMLDFSDATLQEIFKTLRWKKISEFPLSPTVLNDDKFIVVDDPAQTEALYKLSVFMSENEQAQSSNILENMDLENTDTIISDYSLKTVRVTAAEFVQYLSTHIKNFVLWYPVYNSETHELSWERTVNDTPPHVVDLMDMVADLAVATHEFKGLMSAQDKIDLDRLVATDFATQEELDTYKISVNEKFAQTVSDFDGKLTNYVTKNALVDQYYTKNAIDTLLTGKSNTDHLHDDRYLQLTQYNDEIAIVNTDLDKAYNAVALTNTTDTGKQTITGESFPQTNSVDHVTITNTYTFTSRDGSTTSINVPYEYYKYRMATSTYSGLFSNEDYVAVHTTLPTAISDLRTDVPIIVRNNVKVGELANDIGYLTATTLPIATDTIKGSVRVGSDSRISIDDHGYINTKDFSTLNILKNSTFAMGSKYWVVSDDNVVITSENVYGTEYNCGKIILPMNSYIQQTVSSTYGKYITLSFDIMGSGNFTISIETPTTTVSFVESFGSADWYHYSKTIDLNESSLIEVADITLRITNTDDTGAEIEFNLKNIMLQIGMYDTGWIPNPYDGNSVVGYKLPFTIDNETIVNIDGVLSSPSEIDDSPLEMPTTFSSDKAFSTNGVKSYIPLYIGNNSLNMTKNLRFTELYNSDLGYGLLFERTSTMFSIRATDKDNALSDAIRKKRIPVTDENGDQTVDDEGNPVYNYVDDIPFRIDLQNNTCNINGNANTAIYAEQADYAAYDVYGRPIATTYVTIDEFNAVLEQLKAAIDALNS